MKSTLRFLLGAVALCMLLMPSLANAQEFNPRDCCDVAAEMVPLQFDYDVIDDRLDELAGNMQLGLTLQEEIRNRVPFTEDDQQAWMDISGVILNIDREQNELEGEQQIIANQIIALNQELATCLPYNGPSLPSPDPLNP